MNGKRLCFKVIETTEKPEITAERVLVSFQEVTPEIDNEDFTSSPI